MGFKALIIFSLMIPVHTQTNADPCSTYKDLSNIARNTSFANSVPCGPVIVPEGWYRFDIDGVGQVATGCPTGNECGTGNKMWINGILPEVDDDVVLLHACVTSSESSCCSRTQVIRVKKCYVGFYVYSIAHLPYCTTVCLNDTNEGLIDISTTRNIESTPGITPMTTADEYKSSETITTEPEAPKSSLASAVTLIVPTQTHGDPCTSYKDLSHIARNTSFADSVPCGSNLVPKRWYRFEDNGLEQVATSCPVGNECGTGNRIWINGIMPGVADGVVSLPACLRSTTSSCCLRAQGVNVKKCSGGFFVYEIGNLPPCTTVCLNDTTRDITMSTAATPVPTQTNGDPCTSYKDLSNIARNTSFGDSVPCGSNLVPKRWYRFEDNGLEQVATSCPVGNECGSGNRIWINGIMPGVADGVVSLPACLKSTTSSCCLRAQGINVKKCSGGFFVYEIGNLPPCTTVCLNDTTQDITMSTATTPDTTTAIDATSDQTSELAVPHNVTAGRGSSDITDASTEPSTVSLTSHLPTTPSPDTTTTSVKRSTDLSSTLATSTSRTTKRTILTSPTTSSSKGSIFSENSSIFSSPTVSLATVASDTEKSEYKASTEFIIATSVGGAVVLMAVGITVCVVKKRRRRW